MRNHVLILIIARLVLFIIVVIVLPSASRLSLRCSALFVRHVLSAHLSNDERFVRSDRM
jgi:hypothetical protein